MNDERPELAAYQELRVGFTAAVSHELRTPLARLLALLDSIGLAGADVEALVESARAEIENATDLIDDVLFLSELESGNEVVALGTTVAAPVVEAVAAELEERLIRADLRVVLELEPGIEVPLRARMLRMVVTNLFENALRYAAPRATLTLSLRRDGGAVVLTGADDGPGVDEADLPRLFERFYRGDRARSSRGTGLGLAIVKHVVTSAGGSVEARGGPGRGLEIRCSFPPSS